MEKSAYKGTDDKPTVHEEGLEVAVVAVHDTITFEERLTVVEGGLAFLGVVDHHHVEIQKRNVLLGGSLHDADAPVDIGRIKVLLVVGCGDGEVGAGVKGLMADEHTLAEGLPCEVLGR